MLLVYSMPDNTTIRATLTEGERLGNYTGPAVMFVPTDPANAEYAQILADSLAVDAFNDTGGMPLPS